MIDKGTVTLSTQRLILRKIKLTDAKAMYDNWATNYEVTKYLTWKPHKDINETKKLILEWNRAYLKDGYYHWGVEFDGELIGTIGVVASLSNYEIGYCLSRKYWGQGMVTEAVSAIFDYLFGECGIHKIFALHAAANIGSGKVMEKCKMTKEGTLRKEYQLHSGEWADCEFYGILADEWLDK